MSGTVIADTPTSGNILPRPDLGGATTWIMAMMTCLAMLGLAAALALTPAAAALGDQIAGRATVQVVDGDPIARRAYVAHLRDRLNGAPFVRSLHVVPEEELNAMAARWLGDGVREARLPLPALIDVDMVSAAPATLDRLRLLVRQVDPRARVIAHADWLGPVVRLITGLGWLAALIALALAAAAAAVAILSARTAFAAQRSTIDILHLVGATDAQIARMFGRHSARSIVVGALLGAFAAIVLIALIGWAFAGISAGIADSGNGWRYLALLLVPPALIGLALVSARLAVLRALGAML